MIAFLRFEYVSLLSIIYLMLRNEALTLGTGTKALALGTGTSSELTQYIPLMFHVTFDSLVFSMSRDAYYVSVWPRAYTNSPGQQPVACQTWFSRGDNRHRCHVDTPVSP